MLSQKSLTQNLKPNIPTYLSLAEATRKYGLSEKVLTQMIQIGKIKDRFSPYLHELEAGIGDFPCASSGMGKSPEKFTFAVLAPATGLPARRL